MTSTETDQFHVLALLTGRDSSGVDLEAVNVDGGSHFSVIALLREVVLHVLSSNLRELPAIKRMEDAHLCALREWHPCCQVRWTNNRDEVDFVYT